MVESVETAAAAGQTVKVVASGHSFSDVAVTTGRMLRIGALDRVVAIDRDAMTATVEAGIPLWVLNDELAKRDLALSNLGDIDRQTIAGATSTGHARHRSPVRVDRRRDRRARARHRDVATSCAAPPPRSPRSSIAARVGLGVLGVVTQLTLQCEPLFRLRAIEVPKPWDEFLVEWDAILEANDHVDCYWFPHTDTCTVKTSNRTDDPIRTRRGYKKWKSEIYYGNFRHGANAALGRRRPERIPALAQGVVAGMHRTERVDVSYHVFCTTRLVRFVEMEYAIRRAEMATGLRGIRDLIEREGLLVDFPVEIRGIGPDDIPLSMGSGRETCYLAVHMSTGTPYERVLPRGRGDHEGPRRSPALGEDALPDRRVAGPAIPGVVAVPSGAETARSGRQVWQTRSLIACWAHRRLSACRRTRGSSSMRVRTSSST